MLNIHTPQAIGEMDRQCEPRTGLPSLILMENAASAVARAVRQMAQGRPIWVVCGAGNNGGDGWAAARRLWGWGLNVHLWALKNPAQLKGDAAVMARAALGAGVRVHAKTTPPRLSGTTLLVDAVFGTGLSDKPTGPLAAAVVWLARQAAAGQPLLAVDVPSGLCGLTGKTLAPKVPVAAQTLTFGFLKTGLLSGQGPAHTGDLTLVDIGYPPVLAPAPAAMMPQWDDIASLLPRRSATAHKRQTGTVLVIGGSGQYPGAPLLCANAAYAAGAGLVTLAVPQAAHALVARQCREVIPVALPETDKGTFSMSALPQLLELAKRHDAVALGPGLGRHFETSNLVAGLLKHLDLPMVVDADALNAMVEMLKYAPVDLPKNAVFTPHHGEWWRLSRALTGQPVEPLAAELSAFTQGHGGAWLIKQPRTLVGQGGRVWFNPTGSAALATAGSGDVLSGVIAALLSRGLDPAQAAMVGAFWHGLVGNLLSESGLGENATASQLSPLLAQARQRIAESAGKENAPLPAVGFVE